jgi:hypothetical protein
MDHEMSRSIADLRGKNIVVYDLEIKNIIDQVKIGWKDFDKMGISVGCLFDYQTGENHVYMDDNIHEMGKRICDADIVVGFNILAFDNNLLYHTIGVRPADNKCYDLLKEVRRSTGREYPKGCNLNEVLSATFGMKKTEEGADAPIFYQQKKFGKLTTYVLADVRRERMCFEQAYVIGVLKTATNGLHEMRNPLEMLK